MRVEGHARHPIPMSLAAHEEVAVRHGPDLPRLVVAHCRNDRLRDRRVEKIGRIFVANFRALTIHTWYFLYLTSTHSLHIFDVCGDLGEALLFESSWGLGSIATYLDVGHAFGSEARFG